MDAETIEKEKLEREKARAERDREYAIASQKRAKLSIQIADMIQQTCGDEYGDYELSIISNARHILRAREIMARSAWATSSSPE